MKGGGTMEVQSELEATYLLKRQQNNRYSKVMNRINLQAIGYYIKDGCDLLEADKTSFVEREVKAELELEKELRGQIGEEALNKLLPVIMKYVSIKEEIQFSLGMKAGAKIALLLTNDFERDF